MKEQCKVSNIGVIKGSKTYSWDRHPINVELLDVGSKLLSRAEDRFFPVYVGKRYSRFLDVLIEIFCGEDRLLGGSNQIISTLRGFKELKDITTNDIVYRGFEDAKPITSVKIINVVAPVYVIIASPDIPFIVNNFIVSFVEGV